MGEIVMTGKRFSRFPLTQKTEIRQFTDPTLTISSNLKDLVSFTIPENNLININTTKIGSFGLFDTSKDVNSAIQPLSP